MKRVLMMALVGAIALMLNAAAFSTETFAGRGNRHRHYSNKRSHDRHSFKKRSHYRKFHHRRHHRRHFRRKHYRHRHYGHRSHFSLFFDVPLRGSYYGYPYPRYYGPGYTYRYSEPVLMYKEAPQSQGYVKLEVFPGEADVYLDGSYRGKAVGLAGRPIPVSPGVHRLRLRIGGFSSYYQLEVLADRTVSFSKNLPAFPTDYR